MNDFLFDKFVQSFIDTLTMVGISCGLAFLAGLPLAILLVVTAPAGLSESRVVHKTVSFIVNIFRATPFIILLILLIPVTRAVVNTTIGVSAAIVPLTVSLIPYFARIAEVSLREVRRTVIEAALSVGCNRWHVIRHVIFPEALPSIFGAMTVTVIAAINASAMAGAVGAGGLGDMAVRYGYQRYNTTMMLLIVCALVALVTAVQLLGDLAARKTRHDR